MTGNVKRPYDASRRQAQARETRAQVVRAAHDLFLEHGYGGTTVADVAGAAGVSPETIYGAFGSKAGLLHRVWDVTIGGDDEEVVFHERPEILAMRAEKDLRKRLAMHAQHYTSISYRTVPFTLMVQAASGHEPAAADLLAEMGRQRYEGMRVMAAAAAATGQLGVSEEECRDVMWTTTDGALWHRLVEQRRWSDARFSAWLARLWVDALQVRARPSSRSRRGV
jgi:AcrR family transcriptional regulator